MNPAVIAKAGTEHAHQAALFCWAAQNTAKWPVLKWLFAIPNGGMRDRVTASRLKAEGVKPGVSDISLPVARRGFHGIFVEMKKPDGGRESAEQIEFGAFLAEQGFFYMCCHSWDSAASIIAWYLGNEDGSY